MKKNDNSSILNRNKKKIAASVGRQPKYIYTEADLGEGLLDTGVRLTHKTIQRESKITAGGSFADSMLVTAKIPCRLKILNVAEDFSYACYY